MPERWTIFYFYFNGLEKTEALASGWVRFENLGCIREKLDSQIYSVQFVSSGYVQFIVSKKKNVYAIPVSWGFIMSHYESK